VLILDSGSGWASCWLATPTGDWSGKVLGVFLVPGYLASAPYEWQSTTPQGAALKARGRLRDSSVIDISGMEFTGLILEGKRLS